MPRDAIWVLFSSISVWIHVVPHKVAYEWKALAKPLHGFMQVVCIVGVDDGVDVTGNAHVGNVAQAGNQS